MYIYDICQYTTQRKYGQIKSTFVYMNKLKVLFPVNNLFDQINFCITNL